MPMPLRRGRDLAAAVLIPCTLVCALAFQREPRRRPGGTFHTAVPPHLYDITLSRPRADAVTAIVLAYDELEGRLEFDSRRSPLVRFPKGEPVHVVLDALQPDARYTYRLLYRRPGSDQFERSNEYAFHTQRKPGSSFTFAVQADSHLDENTDPDAYRRALESMRADSPDFLIDLGDTFMTDKRPGDFREALPQYLAQRYYFGLLCHSAPLFLVLGNHDGEGGFRRGGASGSMAAWSHGQRTRLFPNPRPDGFYSGNTVPDPVLGPLENYYAWHWGDALFVALDPFWATNARAREDNWNWTLGYAQYRWLKATLAQSRAAFKFVFLHHPTGAKGQPIRGGIEAARYNEWGGRNEDDSDGFRLHRPGWDLPVHRLLASSGVTTVFHGHDHMYAREELDGVVYQLVPQPGNSRAGAPRNAREYGYIHGDVLGGSGYLRVRVTPQRSVVNYVNPHDADGASVARSYSLAAGRASGATARTRRGN